MDPLQEFIRGYRQSRVREHLLTARLIHDAGIAAAAAGYHLLIYTPTVDSDGFDVIFDDHDRLVPLQLKSMHSSAKAGSWKIHRSLIRPQREYANLYGFENSPLGVGRGGGVVLTTAAASNGSVSVTYSYTDVAILTLKWKEITPALEAQRQRLQKLRNDLQSDVAGKVDVPRSAFISCPTLDHLLASAGLKSRLNTSWRDRLVEFLEAEERQAEFTGKEMQDPADSPELYREALIDEVNRLQFT